MKTDKRIRITPRKRLEEAIEEVIVDVRRECGITLSRAYVLESFAEEGVKAWRKRLKNNGALARNAVTASVQDGHIVSVQE